MGNHVNVLRKEKTVFENSPAHASSSWKRLPRTSMGLLVLNNRALPVLTILFSLVIAASQNGVCGPVYDRVIKAGIVRVGVPYNLVPQGFFKTEKEWTGFEVELAHEMANHAALKLETVKVTDKTWRTLLSKGEIDAALCRIRHTRSLESEFDFSIPYFYDSLHIITVKGNFKTPADLKGQKLAALQGSPAEKAAMKLLQQAGDPQAQKNVLSYPDRPSCFLAFTQEKVAGWIDSGILLVEYAATRPGRFELLPASDQVEPIAIAVPQDDSRWRDLINFALQDMVADGTLGKLYEKWFGPDTPYAFPLRRTIEIWPP